jgi:hypothetical protein
MQKHLSYLPSAEESRCVKMQEAPNVNYTYHPGPMTQSQVKLKEPLTIVITLEGVTGPQTIRSSKSGRDRQFMHVQHYSGA